MIFTHDGFFLTILLFFIKVSSQKLDLSDYKKQQTYPANTLTTVTLATTPTAGAPTTTTTTTSAPTTTTVIPCNKGCDVGWLPYNGHCYKTFAQAVNRANAEKSCVENGAHLTSFESANEATTVKNLLLDAPLFSTTLTSWLKSSQLSWIGLSKPQGGAWSWSDSSDVLFINLPSGYTSSDASCVLLNNSLTWQPTSCTTTAKSYICKKLAAF